MSGADQGTSTQAAAADPGTVRTSRWSALALSPRAAVLLAAIVVGVAMVVVVVDGVTRRGSSGGSGGVVSVTGAPSAGASAGTGAGGASGGNGEGRASGGTDASVGPGPGGAASDSAGVDDGSVVVHVIGAVAEPGLVTLPAGSRVSDAVERAGGATGDAELGRVNLARVVADGERLWVPAAGETDAPAAVDGAGGGGAGIGGSGSGGIGSAGSGPGTSPSEAPVDLNTADRAALETLPGIGPALADRIIAWREEHGGFRAVEDLLDVPGIGDRRFSDLRDRVRV